MTWMFGNGAARRSSSPTPTRSRTTIIRLILIIFFGAFVSFCIWSMGKKLSPLFFRSSPRQRFERGPGLLYHVDIPSQTPKGPVYNTKTFCKNTGIKIRFMILPSYSCDGINRLAANLQKIQFKGCPINLHLLLINDQGSLVTCVDQLKWTVGKSHTTKFKKEVKLEDAIMVSWDALDDKEFLLVWDEPENVIANENLMDYLANSIAYYFSNLQSGEKGNSMIMKHLAGVGTGSNDLNQTLGSPGFSQFIYQRPIGSLLFSPWFWRELNHFVKWKRSHPEFNATMAREQPNSWRRYVEEFSLLNGYSFMYPVNITFTSQNISISDTKMFLRRMVPSAGELPVFNWDGKRLMNVNELPMKSPSVDPQEYAPPPATEKYCLLDFFSSPVDSAGVKRKFFSYEPYGNILQQIEDMKKAFVVSSSLKRTLIIPPLIEFKNSTAIVAHQFLYKQFGNDWLSTTPYHNFPWGAFPIKRYTNFHTENFNYSVVTNLKSPLFREKQISLGERVSLPILWSSISEVMASFGGCTDEMLHFGHFHNIISEFDDLESQGRLKEVQSNWNLTEPFSNFLGELRDRKWGSPMACVIYPSDELPFSSFQKKLIDHSQSINIKISSIYFLDKLPPRLQISNNLTSIYKHSDLVAELEGKGGLEIPKESLEMVSSILEFELCKAADLFVSDSKSDIGRRIMELRGNSELPTIKISGI